MATSQTLSPVDHIPEPNARTAIDQLGIVMTNAGIGANGTITSGAFNGTVGATTPSTGAFTTLSASSGYTGRTSGSNPSAGTIGEIVAAQIFGTATTATVTITIASPGVVTWTAHGFSTLLPQPVVFTTTISLPTGITAGTVYYTVPSSVTTNTFQIATTVANALAGTSINTSGSQSGTQTGTAGCAMANNTVIDVTGYTFSAGDWQVWAGVYWNLGTTTTWTKLEMSLNQSSATLATPPAVVGSGYSLLAQVSAAATNGVSDGLVGPIQLNISSPTTLWLSVKGGFAISTAGAFANFMARRMS